MGILLTDDTVGPAGEFLDKVLQALYKTVYAWLYESVQNSINMLFDFLNQSFSTASSQITLGPRLWNHGSAYETVQRIAENICIPIAGAFITVVLCWELIHLVQESNSMNTAKPEKLFLILLKFGLCLFVCAYSFKIVTAFEDVGIKAARALRAETSTSISVTPTLQDLGLAPDPTELTLGDVMNLVGYKLILFIARFAVLICGVVVYVKVMMWFVEFLAYASAAPIPYSTWINKEWAQVGMNYTRKMLSLSFEGFFILLMYALYGGVLGGLEMGNFAESIAMILGCGFSLAIMTFKAGNISASIFNAH